MHQLIRYDRRKLSAREAQFLEALLTIVGGLQGTAAMQAGHAPAQAARLGAQWTAMILAPHFPDLDIRFAEPPPISASLPADPSDQTEPSEF